MKKEIHTGDITFTVDFDAAEIIIHALADDPYYSGTIKILKNIDEVIPI